MIEAVQEVLWLISLMNKLRIIWKVLTIYCDNQSAIQLSRTQVFYERTKHVDIKLNFIREELRKGSVKIKKVSTEQNPLDMIIMSLLSKRIKTKWEKKMKPNK